MSKCKDSRHTKTFTYTANFRIKSISLPVDIIGNISYRNCRQSKAFTYEKNKHAKFLGILQHLPLEDIHQKHLPRVPNLTTVLLVKEQFSFYR